MLRFTGSAGSGRGGQRSRSVRTCSRTLNPSSHCPAGSARRHEPRGTARRRQGVQESGWRRAEGEGRRQSSGAWGFGLQEFHGGFSLHLVSVQTEALAALPASWQPPAAPPRAPRPESCRSAPRTRPARHRAGLRCAASLAARCPTPRPVEPRMGCHRCPEPGRLAVLERTRPQPRGQGWGRRMRSQQRPCG